MRSREDFESITPAKGVRGIILCLDTLTGRRPFFRVYRQTTEYRSAQMKLKAAGEPYDEDAWGFDDYDIEHYDFDVVIDEDHAVLLVRKDGKKSLDYSYFKEDTRRDQAKLEDDMDYKPPLAIRLRQWQYRYASLHAIKTAARHAVFAFVPGGINQTRPYAYADSFVGGGYTLGMALKDYRDGRITRRQIMPEFLNGATVYLSVRSDRLGVQKGIEFPMPESMWADVIAGWLGYAVEFWMSFRVRVFGNPGDYIRDLRLAREY